MYVVCRSTFCSRYMPTLRVPSRGSCVITAGSVMNGAGSPGQQRWIGSRSRSTSSPVSTISCEAPLRTVFGRESAIDFSFCRPRTFATSPSGGCISRTSPSLRPTSSSDEAPKPRHIRRSVPNWLISSGCRAPLTFSKRRAGPPALTTRSLISVISRSGSTSAETRTSSPSRSRSAIQARRSAAGAIDVSLGRWSRGAAADVVEALGDGHRAPLRPPALEFVSPDDARRGLVFGARKRPRRQRLPSLERLDGAPEDTGSKWLAPCDSEPRGQCEDEGRVDAIVHRLDHLEGAEHRLLPFVQLARGDEALGQVAEGHAAPPVEPGFAREIGALVHQTRSFAQVAAVECDAAEDVEGDRLVAAVAARPAVFQCVRGNAGGTLEVTLLEGADRDPGQQMPSSLVVPCLEEELPRTQVFALGEVALGRHVVGRAVHAHAPRAQAHVHLLVGPVEEQLDPALSAHRITHREVQLESPDQLQAALDLARGERPGKRSLDVAVLRLHEMRPLHPARFLGEIPFLAEVDQMLEQPRRQRVPLVREQQLHAELANRLEHAEALQIPATNQALVHEGLEHVQVRVAPALGGAGRPAPAEDRESSEQRLLARREKLARPLDRRAKRS